MRKPIKVAIAGLLLGGLALAAPAHAAATTGIDVKPDERHQTIDGFGYATAFGRTKLVYNLPAEKQQQLLDLLLSRSGASPSILRLGISSGSNSILATDPGSPTATAKYTWDAWDDGQLWFSKEAKKRGVKNFYANAWSAPGYMKDNGSEANGGQLCGLQGVECADGEDWREAYAKYLVQYAKFYKGEGIKIGHLGFVNEPDYHPSYSSMEVSPAQAAEFLKILGPKAKEAGVKLTCCESFGWDQGKPFADAIRADKDALKQLSVFTGHSYASRSDNKLAITNKKKTWMSEWAPSSTEDGWNEAWDSGKVSDAINVAESIQDTLAEADASAYLYWYGVSSGGTAALIQVDPATQDYKISKRYYVFAAYSRFIQPGAERIGVSSDASGVKVSAYLNADGSTVVQLLNLGNSTVKTSVDLGKTTTGYLTDSTHSLEATDTVFGNRNAKRSNLVLPARSLVTLVQPKS